MEEGTRRIVYGNEIVCNLHQISEPIKQIIFDILNSNYEVLDISEVLSNKENVCIEIDHVGKSLVTIAGKLRDKVLLENNCVDQSSVQGKSTYEKKADSCDADSTINASFGMCNKTGECDLLDQMNAVLTVEHEKNDKLQSAINELRSIQEQRLTRLEDNVKQAENAINEKLKVKKLDKRKEKQQNVLNNVYGTRLQRNKQEERKLRTPRVLASSPQCHSKITEQGYEHTRVGSPAPCRSLREKKEELQLQEEIKWSRITTLPVHSTRKKYHHNLALESKKS